MSTEPRTIRVAIEGCGHGELDKIYETMQRAEQQDGRKIDLLICCGDFQAVRNLDDLECMACPPKYRHMATFYKYYSGEKVAPYPTLFIGGNHEASNYLWELYHGGWVAPNIYFLGYAGVITFGGLRIAGLSGIYKPQHYEMGHYESPPYTESTMRSAYHIRSLDVHRLLCLRPSGGTDGTDGQESSPIDIFLSHDWPAGIARYGDTEALLRRKTFLRREVEEGSLGSPPAAHLLNALRPRYWFSAHLHTKFAALVPHADGGETRFLSLDKCLPGRQFLQIVDFVPRSSGSGSKSDSKSGGQMPSPSPTFEYDIEWLTVLRQTHGLTSLVPRAPPLPPLRPVNQEDMNETRELVGERGVGISPDSFRPTAPVYVEGEERRGKRGRMPQHGLRNPQTVELLSMLGLPYNLDKTQGGRYSGVGGGSGSCAAAAAAANPEEIELAEEEEEETMGGTVNPEEIELMDDDDDNSIDPAVAAILSTKAT